MKWHVIQTDKDMPEQTHSPVLVGIACGKYGYYAVATTVGSKWFSTWDGFEILGKVVKWAELPDWEV